MINNVGATHQAVMAAAIFTSIIWCAHLLAEILKNPFDFWASDLNLKVLHNDLNEKLRLGCGVRPEDVPVLPGPPHIAVTHTAHNGEPDWSEIETKVQNAEVRGHTHVLR